MTPAAEEKPKDKYGAPAHDFRSHRNDKRHGLYSARLIFRGQACVQFWEENERGSSPASGSSVYEQDPRRPSTLSRRCHPYSCSNHSNPRSPPASRPPRHDDQHRSRLIPARVSYPPPLAPSEFRSHPPKPTLEPSDRPSSSYPPRLPSVLGPSGLSGSRWSPIPMPPCSPLPEPTPEPRWQLCFANFSRPDPITATATPPSLSPLPSPPPERAIALTLLQPRHDGPSPTRDSTPPHRSPPPLYSRIDNLAWSRPPSYSMSSVQPTVAVTIYSHI
ncbi:hypothetical protein FRC11_006398 [Ceratobasidium sp. 423]|nr:hypothetical protein FRC11_006398 [Ceratobasidium sp. 423]